MFELRWYWSSPSHCKQVRTAFVDLIRVIWLVMIPFVSDPFLAGIIDPFLTGIIQSGSFILKGGVCLITALGMKSLKLETVTDEVSTLTIPDSLVEEAAGTCIFKERKSQVQKTIQKKQTCIMQTTSLLAEETVPKLDLLWEEKCGWVEFVRGWAELKRVGRMLRAWGREQGEGQGAGEPEVVLIKLRLRVEIGEGKVAVEEKRPGGLAAKFTEVQSCLLTVLEHILTRSFQSHPVPSLPIPKSHSPPNT